jgi:sugar phosphate isomerase/epimerase
MTAKPLAVQLYTLREMCSADFPAALRAVADIGYKAVELAGFNGMETSRLRATLDELGLKAPASHMGINELEGNFDRAVADHLALGCEFVIVPWLPENLRDSEAAWLATAQRLETLGRRLKDKGLSFAYHNHDMEFAKFGGRYAMDILLDATDPEFVAAEFDTFWIARGGEEPAAFMRKHAARCRLVHLKDMKKEADRGDNEVGEGCLDWTSIFATIDKCPDPWLVVELDNPRTPATDSISISLRNLRRMGRA